MNGMRTREKNRTPSRNTERLPIAAAAQRLSNYLSVDGRENAAVGYCKLYTGGEVPKCRSSAQRRAKLSTQHHKPSKDCTRVYLAIARDPPPLSENQNATEGIPPITHK